MTTRTLFPDVTPPEKVPHNGTLPSKLAAKLMKPHAALQRERVLEFIRGSGNDGATDEQIQDALELSGNSERPRRRRLVELGQVKDSGNLRMTRSGVPASVWIACPNQTPQVLRHPQTNTTEPILDYVI